MSDISAFGVMATLPAGRDGQGMCGAPGSVSEAGRTFSADVVLGSFRLRGPLVVPADDVLSSLHIDPR